ncbi:dentin sialophosphoprotein-like [Mizuhopecten yessoensis]|uniref:Uncharacterized protein n=1 Tax=Mizuhopecten yessoensis TaxID=6573 RepID=A0A210QFD7_MIZYE|nr:dentin sialophosphoprotein-like [Mizuhopecten yessoensis]XP_021359545.1 dentin sialophosphoprotein-like [Mizuhopecten yessoensis]OWF47419.1 hypothetical protein KP79_PYT22881 [Mizuhopecten yessoensis]
MKRAAMTQVKEVTILLEDYGHRHSLAKKNKSLPENTIKMIEKISLGLAVNTEEEKKLDRRQLNISFSVTNSFDTKRQQSLDDIRQILENATQSKDRFMEIKFVIMCIIVSIDIKPPSTAFEPTALCLAERVRAFLLRDKITLSDETETRLHVNRDSISITLKDHPDDGLPIVGIGQAAFAFQVGDIVILQGTVISVPTVTSIQWFKIEDDGTERMLPIDNKKYLGGSRESPSLVIANSKKADEGVYMLEATNVNGTARSTNSQLIMLSTGEEVEASDSEDDGDTDSADSGNTTNENANPVNTNNNDTNDTDTSSVDSDTDVANTTTITSSTTQNGNASHNETHLSSVSRVNPTQNGVTSSSREDDRNTITAIVNQAAHTIGEQSGNLGTSLVSSDVDSSFSRVRAEYGSEAAEAVDTSDEDQEEIPGLAKTKEVEGQPGSTTRDSDDCSR